MILYNYHHTWSNRYGDIFYHQLLHNKKQAMRNMEEEWTRSDLGMNVDGYLFVDVDRDEYADVIAEALPDVYWFEADNMQGSSWTCRKVGEIPETDHVNGQGGRHAQLISGGKGEVILAAARGIWAATVPVDPNIQSNWKFNLIIKTGSSEGIGIGDIDGDGDYDILSKPYNWDTPRLDIFINETSVVTNSEI